MDQSNIKELEAKVERLRTKLHNKVGSDGTKLSDSSILPLSKELDALIIDYMKAKDKTKTHGE